MRKSQRISRHLQYKLYATKGVKVYKEENQVVDLPDSISSGLTDMSQGDEGKSLEVDIFSLTDDINDYITETTADDLQHSVADCDAAIQRVEDFRSLFRQKHRKILEHIDTNTYTQKFQKNCEEVIRNCKEFIADVKQTRKKIRSGESETASDQARGNRKYFDFLKIELSTQINELETEVLKEPKHFDDDDLLVKRNQSDQLQKKIDIVWNKISEMMKMNID